MATDKINELFSELIRTWRTAESQRTIFGPHMLQTKKAIDKLWASFRNALSETPSFSLMKKGSEMAIVIKTDVSGENPSGDLNIPAPFPSILKSFEQLKIDSISILNGITDEDLQKLFNGLSLKEEQMEAQGGLKGFLKNQGVTHIEVDQVKFALLKDGDEVGTDSSKGSLTTAEKQAKKDLAKLHDSLWKDYIEGKLDKEEFKNKHKDLIEMASKDPKQLEKILKRMIARQAEAEKFLAHLEQKLFDVGMDQEEVNALKKHILKPKKILIEESELARLRKIEEEYLQTADQRLESTLDTIEAIKTKLSSETERSEAIVHQLGQGGMILDKTGKIVSVNDTAQKVLGFSEKEVLGKTVKEILKPHHILTAVSDWQKESETFTPKEIKVKALNEETLAIIRESAIIIENEDGRSIGVLSALQNIIQQEELNRRKNDILDVLGHDLRAPLGAIKMNFEVLSETVQSNAEKDERQKKFLDNCQTSIARMNGLIEKILDTRQLETGKILLKYSSIQTNALIEQAVTSVSEWAKNKNITLQINTSPLPDIEGDAERIYQVITNLVSNALKFTPEGGTITAMGKPANVEEIECVEIAVKDSGMGIDKTNLTKIFDKYEQVTVNAPKGVRGLGLGLSICKAILELHGGRIWVESELEKGSTFTFQVPVKRKEEK